MSSVTGDVWVHTHTHHKKSLSPDAPSPEAAGIRDKRRWNWSGVYCASTPAGPLKAQVWHKQSCFKEMTRHSDQKKKKRVE